MQPILHRTWVMSIRVFGLIPNGVSFGRMNVVLV